MRVLDCLAFGAANFNLLASNFQVNAFSQTHLIVLYFKIVIGLGYDFSLAKVVICVKIHF